VSYIYLSFALLACLQLLLNLVSYAINYAAFRRDAARRSVHNLTNAVCIYMLFTPMLLKQGMLLVECRKIGEQFYIAANTLYECYTS
jgi:hypothetical protein